MLTQVRAAFEGERRLHLRRYPIQMHVHGGILRLEGEVEDVVAKKLALRLAAAVAGVEGIVDRLRVAPALPMGDGAMRDRLRDILLREPLFEPCAIGVRIGPQLAMCREALRAPRSCIEVAVDAGVVTLTGQVPSLTHKRLAGVLAWWAPGSRDVMNGLAVMLPQEDSDAELTAAVQLVLEKDPFLHAGAACLPPLCAR